MSLFKIVSVCKGGGYRYCRTEPQHPKANAKGLYPLHRVLMENQIGRLLRPGEDVHHKDDRKDNDDPRNLEIKGKAAHGRHHHPPKDLVTCRCAVCGAAFRLKANLHRLRMKRAKKHVITCSRRCGGILGNIRCSVEEQPSSPRS